MAGEVAIARMFCRCIAMPRNIDAGEGDVSERQNMYIHLYLLAMPKRQYPFPTQPKHGKSFAHSYPHAGAAAASILL